MTWQPVLDGDLAARANDALDGIAGAIRGFESPPHDDFMFWSYLRAARPDDPLAAEGAEAATERFVEAIEAGYPGFALFTGIAAAGFAAAHLIDDAEEVLTIIDAKLIELLRLDRTWDGPFDLISGLAGLAVYLLERGDAGREGRAQVVELLEGRATTSEAGTTWHTALRYLPLHHRPEFPGGYHNLGMAHGTPGVIAALARIAARDGNEKAARLRDDGVRWLRAQRRGGDGWAGMVETRAPTRVGWCYGDPGVTLALWSVALATGGPDDELIAATQRWMDRDDGVADPNLCHGGLGLAHIANRLYQATRELKYRELARTWVERALAMRHPPRGIAGFFATKPRGLDDASRVEDISADMLDGTIGVGLALLAATTTIEPSWDRQLFCDLPVAP